MQSTASVQLSQFASDVAEGLSGPGPKRLSPRYFYDDLGSALFEAITLLPEYGLTRADERLLRLYAEEIASQTGRLSTVAELGSGTGKKTKHILRAVTQQNSELVYRPIDVSAAALTACELELQVVCETQPVCGDWVEGVAEIARTRSGDLPLLLLFLGSSVGNLERPALVDLFKTLKQHLRPGDFLLLGADLVKDPETMLAAYDDAIGVTAAFNLNVLGRINRELDAQFDLRSFAHEVRWNEEERRIEMHLLSCRDQDVYVGALETHLTFRAGETIWTESSHKFRSSELEQYARLSGFTTVGTWVDREWPFAEVLWQVL
jgi:L-histidine N-alpha-methyltransferase